jgi:hypothetical protein
MALPKSPYGKDDPERFISGALTGGSGPSNGIRDIKVDRPDQMIKEATPMDNVKLAMPIKSSILEEGGFAGGLENLKHSLTGASTVSAEKTGAAGKTKETIIPNH